MAAIWPFSGFTDYVKKFASREIRLKMDVSETRFPFVNFVTTCFARKVRGVQVCLQVKKFTLSLDTREKSCIVSRRR